MAHEGGPVTEYEPLRRGPAVSSPAMAKTKVKTITVQRGFLGFGERRRIQNTIQRMLRKGWTHTDTTRGWQGTHLTFTRDG